ARPGGRAWRHTGGCTCRLRCAGRTGACMRFALEVTEAVPGAWPQDGPLFFRMSSVDGRGGDWDIDDSVRSQSSSKSAAWITWTALAAACWGIQAARSPEISRV